MLNLTLRQEFQGRRLRGTAIELANTKHTGATQISASDFLGITYPSADTLKAIEAVGPNHGQPLVLIGERGQGKSHLMAMLYHSFTDFHAMSNWLQGWGERLGNSKIAELPLRDGMHVISESLHRQNYKFLWDLLFDRHPYGREVRGMWKGLGEKQTEVPNYEHFLELFRHTPTVLLLDEFQTWFDGLTNTKQFPWRNWASNFVQILSEIASEHPDLLVLVLSVRNGNTDAFQQIQRVGPILVDFKGPTAKEDRQKLLLHRLFENRMQVSKWQIETIVSVHVGEYLRLQRVPPAEHEQISHQFTASWPFAPHLMELLEDQVLVATQAQETRDLIRILADLFKRRADSPVITAADFRLDDEKSGIVALLDSVSNQHHASLRQKALRNLSAVLDAVADPDAAVPHLSEVVAALWLRSLAVGNMAGAESETLQVDITRERRIDDNHFKVELSTIEENSFNIHQDGTRLIFREEENPQAKLIASGRNDRLFTDGTDHEQLIKEVRYAIGGEESVSKAFRVVVLPPNWSTNPWESVVDGDKPHSWDQQLPLLVIPVSLENVGSALGPWLRNNLQTRRNAVRFLLPSVGNTNIFHDEELLFLCRVVVLAERWRKQSSEYGRLLRKYQLELRVSLSKRFDRFAILDTWNYQDPEKCHFHIEAHRALGDNIPRAIDEYIYSNLFIPEDLDSLVHAAADKNQSVGKLLSELQEPRPSGESCIPWLGETRMKEHIIRICARGKIAIDLRGMEYLQVRTGEDEQTAWTRMRGGLGTGRHLDETRLLRPQAVPYTAGGSPPDEITDSDDWTLGGSNEDPNGINVKDDNDSGDSPSMGVGEDSSIFEDVSSLVSHKSTPTSALNLLGEVESWGINTGTQIKDMSLEVSSLTGAQLNALLRALPDGTTYELRLSKEKK